MDYELTSSGRKDMRQLPLSYLGLDSAAQAFLQTVKIYKGPGQNPVMTTIGDLVDVGLDGIEKMASEYFHHNATITAKIIQELQEKLARFGLRLRGSDFVSEDVRVEALELDPQTIAAIKKYTSGGTLGELCIYGEKKLKRSLEGRVSRHESVIDAIADALEKFGLQFEFTKRKLDPEKVFPKKSYLSDLERADDPLKPVTTTVLVDQPTVDRVQDERQLQKNAEVLTPEYKPRRVKEDIGKMDKPTLLASSIKNLYISPYMVAKLESHGITAIRDIISLGEPKLIELVGKRNSDAIQIELSRYHLIMHDSSYTIHNGHLVRDRLIRRAKKSPTVDHGDAVSLQTFIANPQGNREPNDDSE